MKKNVIIIAVISVILIVIGGFLIITTPKLTTTATKDEIKEYNGIMNEYYFRYMDDFEDDEYLNDTSLIKMILYKNKIETQVLSDEEKYDLGIDTEYKVYKYSRKDLDIELKSLYNKEIEYNYIESSLENNIMVIDAEYIYYSIPTNEYVYILRSVENKKDEYTIDILEYEKNSKNTKELEESLNEGTIPKRTKHLREYIIKLEKQNDFYTIKSKVTK